jgi:hypothetical protein
VPIAVNTIALGLEALDPLPVDTLCLFVSEDERPLGGAAGYADWRLCGQLSRLLLDGFFRGARGESMLLPSSGRIGPRRLVVLGLGPMAEAAQTAAVHSALAHAADVLNRAGVESVALEVPGRPRLEPAERTSAVNEAFLPAFRGTRVTLLGEQQARPRPA